MCGLSGILFYPKERSAEEWQTLCHLFTQTVVFNEERGREATGIALVNRDGTSALFKQPVPATEFVKMEPVQNILDSVNQETVCLLGHTRKPTQGTRWNNQNNHPLMVSHTLGIHNGTIKNSDDLFQSLSLSRQGEVDSEIIFRLLDSLDPSSLNGEYLPSVKEKAGLLMGRMTTMSVDLRYPTQLLVIKRGNPLCLHYESDLKALFFSSRYLFLRKAFGRAVITEALSPDKAFLFEADRLPEYGKEPVQSIQLQASDA